jgi:hypothetical protein
MTLPFSDKTVTLYNRYDGMDANGRTAITWYRRILPNCFWDEEFGTATIGVTELNTHNIVCKIPQDAAYLPYLDWAACEERDEHFTLSRGDIIILGAVEDEVSVGMTANQLLDKYARSGAMTVQTASDKTTGPLPHYTAKG